MIQIQILEHLLIGNALEYVVGFISCRGVFKEQKTAQSLQTFI